MRKLILAGAIAASMILLAVGSAPASAFGWYGYGCGGCGYYAPRYYAPRYYAPRTYGYSSAYFYRPYYRPRFFYGGFYRPRI